MPGSGRAVVRAGGLVLALLGAFFVWRSCSAPEETDNGATERERASQKAHLLRAHQDLSGLARAFGRGAGGTVGLVQISGRVLDRSTGAPIPFAEVVFAGPSGENSVHCDDAGHYEVDIFPGFYRSYARAEGYVAVARAKAERLPGRVSAASVAMPREGLAPLAVLFRDQIGVDLSLSPGAILKGRVIDTSGRPIAHAVIGRASGGLRVISGEDVAESDGSGQYELLLPSGTVQLQASHEEFAGLQSATTLYLGPGETQERDLVLTAGCIIEGQVVDSSGEAVLTGSFEQHVGGEVYTPVGEINDGLVRFAMEVEGTVRLRAWPWKHPPTAANEYRCAEGLHFRDESFVVPDADPVMTGYVEDSDGQRVPLAFVDIFSLTPGGATQQERADMSGEFAFYALPQGPYQLSVHVPGKGVVIALADVPSTGVPLRLGGVGSIIGSLSGQSTGSMTMRFHCAFRLDEEEAARGDALSMPMQTLLVPLHDGRFRIDDLPACPLRGTVSTGVIQKSFAVEVKARQEVPLRIE